MRKYILIAVSLIIAVSAAIVSINLYVRGSTEDSIFGRAEDLLPAYTAIVPGAMVYSDGRLSNILYDRVTRALDLYRSGKVSRFLISGDHGTRQYDEVNTIRKFLLARGVRAGDIFTDHAGFSTYNTMVRARKVFLVRDAVIVTQDYHLPRSLYIAREAGIRASGFTADRRSYVFIRYYRFREYFATVKSFIDVMVDQEPRFLGDPIPITGDGRKSWD